MRYVAYFFKRDFGPKDSKWIFEIDFQRDLSRKDFSFKRKETNLKTTTHEKQNTKENKRKTNHKVKSLTTKQVKVVR